MSADEIRRLAVDLKPEEGHYSCDIKTLSPVHSALLAYAAMVERCEEYRQTMKEIGDNMYTRFLVEIIDNIQHGKKGATNG